MIDLSKETIPIFIIVKDRLSVLKESIASYERNIKTPFEIVIHDNGSTFGKTTKYLRNLTKKGVKVYYHRQKFKNKKLELNSVGLSVRDYFKTHKASYYVVTDPDIFLDTSDGDVLEVYAYLLDRVSVPVVGPMLRVDDLPNHYPLKGRVVRSMNKRFWKKPSFVVSVGDKECRFMYSKIDTTFGLYRTGFDFKRKQEGIRVHPPYSARHLDWYMDPENMTEDQEYYLQRCRKDPAMKIISHWSGVYLDQELRKGKIR